ncbi:hypothetical protein ACA910_022142 [Epithemia clementina (nom. ined.)]
MNNRIISSAFAPRRAPNKNSRSEGKMPSPPSSNFEGKEGSSSVGDFSAFEEEYNISLSQSSDRQHQLQQKTNRSSEREDEPDNPVPSSESYAGRTTLSDHHNYDDSIVDDDVGSLIGDYALPGRLDRSIGSGSAGNRRNSTDAEEFCNSGTGPVVVVDQVPSNFGERRGKGGGVGVLAAYGNTYDEIFSQFGLTTGGQNSKHSRNPNGVEIVPRTPPRNKKYPEDSPGRTSRTGVSEDDFSSMEHGGHSSSDKRKLEKDDGVYEDEMYPTVLSEKVFGVCRLDVLIVLALLVVVLSMGAAVAAALLQHDKSENGNSAATNSSSLDYAQNQPENETLPTLAPAPSPSASPILPDKQLTMPSVVQETASQSLDPPP